MELDELVEHWTLLVDEQELIAGKRGSTRLGFALLLKFYVRLGRFPRGRSELPDEAVAFVAKQVGVPPSELGFYEWSGSTIGYHRWQIRAYLGFRECSVQDSDTLTGWLAVNVCETERRHDQVREELLMRCRGERIEPPAAKRVDRIVRSALHQAEQTLTRRIVQAIPADVCGATARPGGRGRDGRRRSGRRLRLRADQVGAGQRQPGLDADRDPQAAGGPRGRPPGRPVRRRRAEGRRGLAGSGRGGIWIAPA